MNEPKFTKGPWKVNTTVDELWGGDVWYNVEYYSVYSSDTSIASDVSSQEDATLIATSPDMYNMIETLVDAIKSVNAVPENAVKIHKNLIDTAESLLKKARGEA